jgi:ABC-2 type transport system ATP-binding protein
MSESPAAQVTSIVVRYGRRLAVDDVTLTVPRGSVYALLGRNGAGKSSLIRCLLGQLRPHGGHAELLGKDVWRHRTSLMDRVGVVPEESDAPPNMRVAELGTFSARIYSRWDQRSFDDRIRRFSIDGRTRFGELSKGQKKQISLALALATSPELLILDDPTLGLDVVARRALFEEVIGDLADRGITVLISTHDLAQVESIADRVGILVDGRLVLDEEVETLKSRFRRIHATGPISLSTVNLVATTVRPWGSGTEAIVSNFDELPSESELAVSDITAMSLEEIFVAVAGEEKGTGR